MPRSRETARLRARAYRSAKARIAVEEELARRGQLSRVLDIVRAVLADRGFIELALNQKAVWAPKRLLSASACAYSSQRAEESVEVLDFVVAWKFLFPVLRNDVMRSYLDSRWPGFEEELKDTFIGLVMKGPFLGERKPSIKGPVR